MGVGAGREEAMGLWDWRRRVAALYAAVRAAPDPRAAWRRWRAGRDALLREHPQSPLDPGARAGFVGLDCFPYDPSLRLLAGVAPVADAAPLELPAGEDGTVRLLPFGRTQGLVGRLGGELTLFWIAGYGGGVFLPFADATSGRSTYGAGRYLLDTIKGADLGAAADGRVVLDFNFAYCPSCAYSPRWACPLPPAANRLPVPVAGGERGTPPGAAALLPGNAGRPDP